LCAILIIGASKYLIDGIARSEEIVNESTNINKKITCCELDSGLMKDTRFIAQDIAIKAIKCAK
jgi:hypothetical protein